MKQASSTDQRILTYNAEVRKAYHKILKQAKALIATVEQHELRCSLVQADRSKPVFMNKVHEFVNPLIYLCLMCPVDTYCIHFGFEVYGSGENDYTALTSRFMRTLYKLTAAEHTAINIEDCISTYNVITECNDLFDYMEERGKSNHTFELIPYKPKPAKRKLMKVA
ncbi:hypothetical protein LLH06_00390 [Mucilaginibacter daejeonensis]|uniref:hypothetical protein n=1 Tax=Mucilaginibacter daejeonensis TaxID=398049 RepID=UPI001D17B288|nr:hypothetical protein [Mucilaginibacter daejeonensis]UEG53435.1 hypothetical protein LLH06_00390 [Mucilaginibacter daejeonensis]